MDIRKIMREKRRKLTSQEKESAAHALLENFLRLSLSFKSIAVYLAFDGEIDPSYITEWAWKNNKHVYLPVLTQTKVMQFAEYQINTELKLNKFNIPEPVKTKTISAEKLDLILVPVVAFDKNFNRLGMGQGYYDATLACVRYCEELAVASECVAKQSSFLLGLAYDFQQVDEIIPHESDVKLNGVISVGVFGMS